MTTLMRRRPDALTGLRSWLENEPGEVRMPMEAAPSAARSSPVQHPGNGATAVTGSATGTD